MKGFEIQDLVHLFYHPRMERVLSPDVKALLEKWKQELRAENSTALGQILSHYPTVMLVGPAQSGKTSIVSGLLNFPEGQRSEWIHKHAGTGAVSKTKVPTRYVAFQEEEETHIPLQPEMEREINRVFQDILAQAPEPLEQEEDELEKATTRIIMANKHHALRPGLMGEELSFSVLDMPGTAASGSNLEELFANTQKKRNRIYNLLKERYLLYKIFPDVAQVLVVVAPLQNLGAAKWAQEDIIDKLLSRHLDEACSLRQIMEKYSGRTILAIPDLNRWNRRENWKEEYWQSLQALVHQFQLQDTANIVFLRAPEIEEAYEGLYDSIWEDLKDSPFREILEPQEKGFLDREDRGFEFFTQRIWHALKKAKNVDTLRQDKKKKSHSLLESLSICRPQSNREVASKLVTPDELEFLWALEKKGGGQLEGPAGILKLENLEIPAGYSQVYERLGSLSPKELYQVLQEVESLLKDIYPPPIMPPKAQEANYILLLDEKEWDQEGWKDLWEAWKQSDFPLHHFSQKDFQEAHRILLYQSTLGERKKIIYPYRIHPVPTNEKARFLVQPTAYPLDVEPMDLEIHIDDEEESLEFQVRLVELPLVFPSPFPLPSKIDQIFLFYRTLSPMSFLTPGRYAFWKEEKKIHEYVLPQILEKFKKQELTLSEIFSALEIRPQHSLTLIEYKGKKGLLCLSPR
ncbi:MAG: hypothetical protein D6785_16600 [Planctomycetota bacterium]|nr:MAG: hypothetical protein D6785_16600 [Planctomycetota bacterium]